MSKYVTYLDQHNIDHENRIKNENIASIANAATRLMKKQYSYI